MSHIGCIVVAAGRGLRAGGGLPKQWRQLAGRMVAEHTLNQLGQVGIGQLVLVVHPDDQARAQALAGDHLVALGGATRAASVRAGLAALNRPGLTHVLIHDVARPCVSSALIARVCAALRDAPAAAPALPVTDALWTGSADRVTGTRDRAGLFRAQTPQGFDLKAIRAAHERFDGEPADDVEVARAAGLEIAIVPGEEDNLKLTVASDFDRAERILRGTMKIRTGNGFDVHAFGTGDHVTLCGVDIPHGQGLIGHSDADVAMHAVTDALYGALARGDIGQHFPPSDPQWKGADSAVFLRHAVELTGQMGFAISNVDCTIICELPKIGPHADAMRARMADIMGIDVDQVSVKATTSERLGFAGRGEGIACLASCSLVSA